MRNTNVLNSYDGPWAATVDELPTVTETGNEVGISEMSSEIAKLYNVRVHIEVRPDSIGSHASFNLSNGSIQIVLDPEQIKGNSETAPIESKAAFITAHEIGHVIIKHESSGKVSTNKARHTFDNLVEDTIIDTRSRLVPYFDQHADGVYFDTLSHDFTKDPKSMQFLWAIRLGSVESQPNFVADPAIIELANSLRAVGDESHDIIKAITDRDTNYENWNLLADYYIWPIYQQLLEQDKQSQQSGEDDNQDGDDMGEGSQNGKGKGKGKGKGNRPLMDESLIKGLEEAIRQQRQHDRNEARKAELEKKQERSNEQQTTRSEQIQKMAGRLQELLKQSDAVSRLYAEALYEYGSTIRAVGDVFLKLSAPTKTINSPRRARRSFEDGEDLHANRLIDAAIQLETGQPKPIFTRTERKGITIKEDFGGIDVSLLIDVSGSMNGERSIAAADTALVLTEGLQLARAKVSKAQGLKQPDVRVAAITFTDNSKTILPPSFEPTNVEKGKMFAEALVSRGGTQVNDALKIVEHNQSAARDQRKQLVFIITDGEFGDFNEAAQTVQGLPKNIYVKQINIQTGGTPITADSETINSPRQLPEKLLALLRQQINGAKS